MIKELLYKWFGLVPLPCPTCEVLKDSLAVERQFNKVLLDKLVDRDKPESPHVREEPNLPITPKFVPWRVKQQMLEAEDRAKARALTNAGRPDINRPDSTEDLERELNIVAAERESHGTHEK